MKSWVLGCRFLFLALGGMIPASGRGDELWLPPEALATGAPGLREPAAAAGPDGHLHVVWTEDSLESGMLAGRIRYREHDGKRWLPASFLSKPWPGALSPAVAVDPLGRPHVAWLEKGQSSSKYLVVHTSRLEAPMDWEPPARLSAAERVDSEGRPRIGFSPAGAPVVIWSDDESQGNSEIFWNHRVGGAWVASSTLSRVDRFHSVEGDLAELGDGRIAVLWMENFPDGRQPVVRIYDGLSWGSEILAGRADGWFQHPRLVRSGESLHVLYSGKAGIGVRTGRPAGIGFSWDSDLLLPTSLESPFFAAASREGRLLIAYTDLFPDSSYLCSRTLSDHGEFDGLPLTIERIPEGAVAISIATRGGDPSIIWDATGAGAGADGSSILRSRLLDVPSMPFLRGDVDGNGTDVGDVVAILAFLFEAGPMGCADAADVNDDAFIGIDDAIALLEYLFASGPAIPPPLEDCAKDPTADAIPCEAPRC